MAAAHRPSPHNAVYVCTTFSCQDNAFFLLSLSFSVLVCDNIIAGIVLVLQQGSTITSLSQISSVIIYYFYTALH